MYRLLFTLCFQIMVTSPAPLSMHLLAPHEMLQRPQAIQSPLPLLQEQLMELQAMQQVHRISPMTMNQIQPIIILLPGFQNNMNPFSNTHQITNKRINEVKKPDNLNDDSEDSVIIDAEPMEPIPTVEETQKAILLLPNARFSIGGIISSIPWLPIEINVPDTISWMYNGIASGISGIISIIGQRFPSQNSRESVLKLKQFNSNLRDQYLARPIIVLPL